MELCTHDRCGCGSERYSDSLKLVNQCHEFCVEYFWISLLHLSGGCILSKLV